MEEVACVAGVEYGRGYREAFLPPPLPSLFAPAMQTMKEVAIYSYPFPNLTICGFVTYDLSLHIRIRNWRDRLNGPSKQLDKISHFEFKMHFHAYLSGKTVRRLLPPSPNSMLVRERSVALVNPDQTNKKN